MRSTEAPPVWLAVPVALLAAVAAFGEPEAAVRWGGRSSPNMASDAKRLPADISTLKPLWEIEVGSKQYSIPTIDRGRIYIGTNDASFDRPGYKPSGGGALMCIDQGTGALVWRFASPRYMEGVIEPYHFDQWKCGICSGPAVDGDRVFVIGNRGEILCLDRDGQADGNDGPFKDELAYMGIAQGPGTELGPTDGDIIWRYDMLRDLRVIPHDVCGSTLLLHGDLLYACTSNGIDGRHSAIPSPLAPSLIVFDKNTGRLVAQDGELIGKRMFHGHWSSPAFGTTPGGKPLIFFGGGDGVLYAFEPPAWPAPPDAGVQTLKKVWEFDCNPPGYRVRYGQPVPYAKDSTKSPEGPSEIIGTPVFHEGRVYVAIGQSPIHGTGQGQLSCVDAATGAKIWATDLVERTLSTVSIADGLLFIDDWSGSLHCFDAGSGIRHWVHDMESGTWGSSTFVADGKVYAGTETRIFWILAAAKEKRVLSRTRLPTVPITPVAADGILYVPTQNRLTAYRSGAVAARPAEE